MSGQTFIPVRAGCLTGHDPTSTFSSRTAAGTAVAKQQSILTVASTGPRIASRSTGTSNLASSLAITDYQSASFVLACRNLDFTIHSVR